MISTSTKEFLLHFCVAVLTGLLLIYGYSITTGPGIRLYYSYANTFLPHVSTGQIFFGRLPIEYPILSLIPMLVPLAVGNALYTSAFIFFMLAIVIGTYLFLFYASSKAGAFAYLLYTIIGGFGIAVGRLDVIMGTLVLLSLYEADKKKYYSAYLFLAIATMFKLVPLFFILPLFVAEQLDKKNRLYTNPWERFHGIGIYIILCFIIFILSFSIGGKDSLSPFLFGLHRPIQVESIPASLLVLLSWIGVIKICVAADFASVNIYGVQNNMCNLSQNNFFTSLSQEILLAILLLFLCSLVYLTRLFIKQKITLAHFYLAVLLVFLATNKVFSPQYLLWIFPLFAYIYRLDKVRVFIFSVIAFITTLIYPFFYGGTTLVPYFGLTTMLDSILVRNVIFIAITYAYVFNVFNLRSGSNEKKRHT